MPIRFCARCGASLSATARFCGHCGRPSPQRISKGAMREAARRDSRLLLALLVVFVGTLLALVATAWWAHPHSDASDTATALGVAQVSQIVVGLLACVALGAPHGIGQAVRGSLAGRPDPGSMALALPVGLAGYAIAAAWIALLEAWLGGVAVAPEHPSPWLVAVVVIGAPLIEEWLGRGVLWQIVAPMAGERGAVVMTATLFALSHGLNGGFVLEFPHRFAGGLLLGWLRLRSGSLLPGIVAHAVWNGAAVWIP